MSHHKDVLFPFRLFESFLQVIDLRLVRAHGEKTHRDESGIAVFDNPIRFRSREFFKQRCRASEAFLLRRGERVLDEGRVFRLLLRSTGVRFLNEIVVEKDVVISGDDFQLRLQL